MPRLIIKMPSGAEEALVLTEPEYSLGRAGDNDIVVEDTDVSRYHCRFVRRADQYAVEDLGSRNGIFLNGLRTDQSVLKDGDSLQAGHHLLTYQAGDVIGNRPETTPGAGIEEDYDQLLSGLTSAPSGTREAAVGEPLAKLEREHETLRLLLDLGNALSAEHSVASVCSKATATLLEVTAAERSAIFLLDQDGKTLRCLTTSGRDEDAAGSRPVVVSRTIAEKILGERKAIVTSDAVVDERFAHGKSVVASGLRSVACAPLLGRSGNLGVLYMENNSAIGAFTHEDLQLLCSVAAQIGLAIEHARFYDELKATNENLECLVQERTAALAETQLKLYQAEKMASLSRLAAGVAHEINNPLGALKSNLDLLTASFGRVASSPEKSPAESRLFENLSEISRTSAAACARIVSVVRSLSSFAHLDEAVFKQSDLNENIRTVVQLLDPSLTRHIHLSLDLGEVPALLCYPALINEALTNILVNACHATSDSGHISIESRREGDRVVLRVRDDGCGISPEHLQSIFDPGFTTKGVGVGIGLGLAVAYSIIKAHRGTIEVESEIGRGTAFTIRLPSGSETAPR